MGARIGAIILVSLSTPVWAQGVLPYDGIYGNSAGCHLYETGEKLSDNYQLLTPDTFTSKAVGCDFEALASSNAVLFTVNAICSPGGRRQVTISQTGQDGYTIRLDQTTFVGPLPPCPSADLLGGNEVSL
jgi:hypothetical protein